MEESRDWILACASEQVREGTPLAVSAGDVEMCLYRWRGTVYATADRCSHGNAQLSEGCMEGNEIECPFHQGRFDICTGRPTATPCTEPIRTFPVREDGGRIEIRLI